MSVGATNHSLTAASSLSEPMAPLRVLLVMPLAELRGGGEMMLWHLVSQGQHLGIEWQVVFLQAGPMVKQVEEVGIKCYVFPAGKMRQVGRLLQTAKKIAVLAKQEGVDLFCGWMGTGQLYTGTASLLSGIPNMWYQLGIPFDKGLIDRIATCLPAQRILACSDAGARAQEAIAPCRPMSRVYPGVELERFDLASLPSPKEARHKLGLPSDDILIGIVGRLQHWKGIHTVLRALPAVQARYKAAKVVVVGGPHAFEPEYPAFLQSEVERLSIADSVVFAGLQTNVPEWMQAMDVMIHASSDEPFGIVVIEAMTLGKPVVATNTAGPTEIITPEKQGLLTPFEDATALSQAILRYLDAPDFAKKVGQAAQGRAQDFAVQHYVEGIAAACRAACGKTHVP